MKRYRVLALLVSFLLSSMALSALSDGEAESRYDEIMLSWIRGEKNDLQTFSRFRSLESELDNLADPLMKSYWLARVNLAVGQIRFYREEEKLSLAALEKSRELARRAAEGGIGADALRIQSDAGSFIMVQKGVGYIIANSGEVRDLAAESLALDEGNVRAALIVAQGLINAPAIFGGNKRKGMADLAALGRRPDLSPEDTFFLLMGLGEVYEGEKEIEEALETYNRLLSRYPENSLVKNRIDRLTGR